MAKQGEQKIIDPREALRPVITKTKQEKLADMQKSIASVKSHDYNDDLLVWNGVKALTDKLKEAAFEALPVGADLARGMVTYKQAPDILIHENVAKIEQQQQQQQTVSSLERHRDAEAMKIMAAHSADAKSTMGSNVAKHVDDLAIAVFGGVTLKHSDADAIVGNIVNDQNANSIQALRTTEHMAGLSHLAYLRQLSQSRRSIASQRRHED